MQHYEKIKDIAANRANVARRVKRLTEGQRFTYFLAKIKYNPLKIDKAIGLVERLDLTGLRSMIDAELGNYRFWNIEDLRIKASKMKIPRYKTLEKKDLIIAIEDAEYVG